MLQHFVACSHVRPPPTCCNILGLWQLSYLRSVSRVYIQYTYGMICSIMRFTNTNPNPNLNVTSDPRGVMHLVMEHTVVGKMVVANMSINSRLTQLTSDFSPHFWSLTARRCQQMARQSEVREVSRESNDNRDNY